MRAGLAAYRLFLAVVLVDLALALWQPDAARDSAVTSWRFLLEVLSIVPPVMVLMGLLDVWVPRRLVESHLGPGSGALGAGLAMLLGTAAAGPLYAAFPVAVSMQRKGARLANVVVFLGTWAAIKIPMLMMESSFVGLRFALLRLAFTVPCILATGWLMERFLAGDGTAVALVPAAEPATAERTEETSR
ncbi:MAG TPA: permease [Anaeromyxobacteraceae bacterium]|nr:permease [Anaeromyxobacteraceae bacterium]